jgi:hypothetical protein
MGYSYHVAERSETLAGRSKYTSERFARTNRLSYLVSERYCCDNQLLRVGFFALR